MMTLGILVSGGGTNLQSILDAIEAGRLNARIAVVLSNKANAGALLRATRANVPTEVLDHKAYPDRAAFDAALVQTLRRYSVEWVVLAGFMRIVTHVLIDAFPLRILNIHPALLPAFPGVDAQKQALAYGVRVTGCTVHFVDHGTDTGPILAQAVVPVLPSDDVETLRARILEREHELLPRVLQWISEGRVRVEPGVGGARPRVEVPESLLQRA